MKLNVNQYNVNTFRMSQLYIHDMALFINTVKCITEQIQEVLNAPTTVRNNRFMLNMPTSYIFFVCLLLVSVDISIAS